MDKLVKHPIFRFAVRWFVCSLGLWVAAALLENNLTYNNSFLVIVIAGLILAIINLIIKPILVILALPAVLITLGLFMVIINGLTVFLASKLYSPLHLTNFWAAILAGMVIGLVNYLVTAIMEGV